MFKSVYTLLVVAFCINGCHQKNKNDFWMKDDSAEQKKSFNEANDQSAIMSDIMGLDNCYFTSSQLTTKEGIKLKFIY